MTRSTDRPLLALDVDGVISLFGYEGGALGAPGDFHWVDGIVHCISPTAAGHLKALGRVYEMVWATGWEDRANDYLVHILGLDGELPVLRFDGEPISFGTAHWKLGAIERFASTRPLAWVDDCLNEECLAWAEARDAPTLLVPTESATGLTDAHVETLIRWARDGYTQPG